MTTLGAYFPGDERRKYIYQQLVPAKVLYLFCTFTTPQKDKFTVLAFMGSPIIFFVINSRISEYIKRRSLEASQVVLKASDYAFLDHDSYVDCSNPRTDFDYPEIERQLLADVGRIRGELNEASKSEIVNAVCQARTISPHHKKLIMAGLQPAQQR